MYSKKYLSVVASGAILAALAMGTPALADSDQGNQGSAPAHAPQAWGKGMVEKEMHRMGIFGTVASVSGNTLTVTSKAFGPAAQGTATPTTYTVDATNAKVTKNAATSTVSAILAGDTVMIRGTLTGTNVVATTIRDGVVPMGKGPEGDSEKGEGAGKIAPNPIITGNGQPVVGGSVTAISGSTLTITNKSNVTYSVNATSAVIAKGNATSTLANIAVGDNVIVQGAVSGNAITASSVIDQGVAPSASAGSAKPKGMMGFFGGIGGFFAHLFGF